MRLISPAILRILDAERDPVRFIEIGANDGTSFDPLARWIAECGWHGVMVEPVPHLFAELARTHGGRPELELVNAAIAGEDGRRTIHHLRPGAVEPALPPWADAVASFDRDHVLRQLAAAPDPASLISSTEIECLSFETLCRRCAVETIDLLLIDAEGADLEILESIDLDRHRPRVLVYEHHHLSHDERSRSETRLSDAGYTVRREALDTWALDTDPADELTAGWERALAADSGA